MRIAATICKVLLWIVLVLSVGFQLLAAFAIAGNNAQAAAAEQLDKAYPFWPLLVLSALLVASAVLFTALKKRRWIGLALAGLAGLLAVVLAFDLMRFFPVQIDVAGERGLNTLKMIYRHMAPVLVPLLMLAVFFLDRAASKREQAQLVARGEAKYDLSGAPLFHDGSTLGLPEEEAEAGLSRREKRSLRVARRKRERY